MPSPVGSTSPSTVVLRERARWVSEHLVPGGRLLDVGCYDGSVAAAWTPWANNIFGIDVNDAILHGHRGVLCSLASAGAIPFKSASFDTVVCSEVVEHLAVELERPALEEMRRVLRISGRLLLTTPHAGAFAWLDPMDAKRRLGLRPGKGHKHYSVPEISQLLSGLFVIDHLDLNSFLFHPISTALGVGNQHRLRRLREALSDWDYTHHFGRASFNMALVALPI